MSIAERQTAELIENAIAVKHPGTPEQVGFVKSLPFAKWDKKTRRWTVAATPLTANRLMAAGYNLCDETQQLAAQWFEASLSSSFADLQPENRQLDSWRHQCEAFWFGRVRAATMLALDMGCIEGDAIISVNRAGNTRKMTLRHAHLSFHGKLYKRKSRKRAAWTCRALKGDRFGNHLIENIIYKGVRPVVKVTLDNGKSIRCTPDHEIAGPDDTWTAAGKLIPGSLVLCNGRDISGTKNPNYKRGKLIDSDGYVRLSSMQDHPRANAAGQVYEHIVVMERKLGRAIGPDEHIHHKDENKANNDPDNLEVLTPGDHHRKHDPLLNLDGGRTKNGGTVIVIPKVAKVLSVVEDYETDVYDIVMADPHRNFVANGIVVHNCGKSKVAVDLLANWGCRRVLILCPKAVLPVWQDQFEQFCPVPHKVLLLDQKSGSKKLLAAMNGSLAWSDSLLAIVVNYESAWRDDLAQWFLGRSWDCVLLDESHKIKAPSGKASSFCGVLGLRAKRRLCLTGTPMGHSPLDLFGQYRFLEPALFGTSYTAFRSRYAVMHPMFPSKVMQWVNQDELQARMATIAYRVKSDDVLDLPPQVHHQLPVQLSDAARKVYDELEAELVAELATGETVVVENALSKLLRLQQITSGFLPVEEPAEAFGADPIKRLVPVDTGKAEALAELLDDLPADEPVVVCCKFRHDLGQVHRVAVEAGRTSRELSGKINQLGYWQEETGGEVLAVQIQSGGAGINLTRARYCVIYSLGYSLTDYEQFLKRQHRPGQDRAVHYYHLVARKTVDVAVYKALRERKEVIESVLSILKRG